MVPLAKQKCYPPDAEAGVAVLPLQAIERTRRVGPQPERAVGHVETPIGVEMPVVSPRCNTGVDSFEARRIGDRVDVQAMA